MRRLRAKLSESVRSLFLLQNDWLDGLSVRNRENARFTKLNTGYVMAELYEWSGTCIRTFYKSYVFSDFSRLRFLEPDRNWDWVPAFGLPRMLASG